MLVVNAVAVRSQAILLVVVGISRHAGDGAHSCDSLLGFAAGVILSRWNLFGRVVLRLHDRF